MHSMRFGSASLFIVAYFEGEDQRKNLKQGNYYLEEELFYLINPANPVHPTSPLNHLYFNINKLASKKQ